MKQFNYYDYLAYKTLKKLEEKETYNILREEGEAYSYQTEETKNINHPYDKLFRLALDNKKEVVKLINRELKLKEKHQLTEKDIEKYNSSFINQKFENQEADVVYKKKDQNIFFLIEHQSKIDYDMPRRILKYEVEIIESALNHKTKMKKKEKMPVIYPIIIYTGTKKWDVERYIEECQERLKGAEKIGLGNYYIVDANSYTEEELLNDVLFISSLMLIEKKKNTEELAEAIEEVIQKKYKENNKLLEQSIYYIYSEKLGKEKTEELLKQLKDFKGKGGKSMVLEMIRKENEELIKRGRKEGKKEGRKEGRLEGRMEGIKQTTIKLIIEMLKNDANEEFIKKVTKITNKELEEIKKLAKKNI